MARHLTDGDQFGWITHELPPLRRASVAFHLTRCAECKAKVEACAAAFASIDQIVLESPMVDQPPAHLDGLILHAARVEAPRAPTATRAHLRAASLRPLLATASLAILLVAGWGMLRLLVPSAPVQIAESDNLYTPEDAFLRAAWQDPWTAEVEDRLEDLEILLAMAEEDLYTPSTPDILIQATEIDTEIQYLFQEIESEPNL